MEEYEHTSSMRNMARSMDTHDLLRELVFLTRRGERKGNNIFGTRLCAVYRAEILRRLDDKYNTQTCAAYLRSISGL